MRIVGALSVAAAIALVVTPVSVAAQPASTVIHVPAVDTPWPGKIFVAHDEWAISDYGYVRTPESARRLTLNLAAWFTGGRLGRFMSFSNFYGLIGQQIAATLTAAGHSWTVEMPRPLTLQTLLQYDAVFVGGDEVDNDLLIDYVRAGGGVFVEGGTGLGGNVWEASHWNPFLRAFGLALGSHYDLDRLPGIYPVASASAIFAGVVELYEQVGNPVLKLDPVDPWVQVLVPYNGHALYASYSTPVVPVGMELCQPLSDDRADWLLVRIAGTPAFDVRGIDPRSVRLLGVAPALSLPTHGAGAPTEPPLAKTAVDRCRPGRDRVLDLTFAFRSRDVLRAAEAILGYHLDDASLVALTLTGLLRADRGGAPIVGQSIVKVDARRRPRQQR
jgi:hypothetical protein